jgi:uncharacterized protein
MEHDPNFIQLLAENAGLVGGLLVAGLVGGAGHCTGMCGPFVLSQVMVRLEGIPAATMGEFQRLRGAALLSYHLGRTTTYAVLGAAAGWMSGGIAQASGWRWISALLLIVAAVFFVGYALRSLGVALPWAGLDRGESGWSKRLGNMVKPLFGRPVGGRGYVLGLVLGLLPCGFLYGSIAAAAAAGSAIIGAVAMAAFALGTVPALFGLGLAGHLAGRRWSGVATRLASAVLLANAGFLGFMAWRLMA